MNDPNWTGETSRKAGERAYVDQTASLKDWLGRKRSEDDELSVGSVRRLGRHARPGPERPSVAACELPESWYAILFGPTAVRARSAATAIRSPATICCRRLPNTRRMFAGRRVKFHKALRVGDMVERVSTVKQVEAEDRPHRLVRAGDGGA